jgi:hypothetical protein
MRNLDGWMMGRMTGRTDGKDDHHHGNRTKPRILYIKITHSSFEICCYPVVAATIAEKETN